MVLLFSGIYNPAKYNKGGQRMSKTISSFYDDELYSSVCMLAKQSNITVSELQKKAVLNLLKNSNIAFYDINIHIENMYNSIDTLEKNQVFIVSELFENKDWYSFNNTEKKSIAMALSRYARCNPEKIQILSFRAGTKVRQYKKIY